MLGCSDTCCRLFLCGKLTTFKYQIHNKYPPSTGTWILYVLLIWRTTVVEASWNVMAHAQKPDFLFRRNGRVRLNWRGRQFSRLLAAEVGASAVLTLGTPCSKVVWRVLATHYIHQFPLHFPARVSPSAITFQLESTSGVWFQGSRNSSLPTMSVW